MPAPTEIDNDVQAHLASEAFDDAARLLSAHWGDYLSENGDVLRERVLALPEQTWSASVPLLLALACGIRSSTAPNAYAAVPYLDAADQLLGTQNGPAGELPVIAALARSAVTRDLGRFAQAHACAGVAQRELASTPVALPRRIELQAHVLLEEGICLTMMCNLQGAGERLREALALWGDRPANAVMVEALGCLALVDYFCATPSAPVERVARVRELCLGTTLLERAPAAPALFTDCLVAIDSGAYERARLLAADLRRAAAGSHYELFGLHVEALLRGIFDGALEQLEALQEIQIMVRELPVPHLIQHLHDTERASGLLQLGALSGARDTIAAMTEIPDPHHALCTARLVARLSLHTADFEAVLNHTAPCRALGDRHAVRSLAWVDAMRATARCALGDAKSAATTFDRVLVSAARSGWRRHLTMLPHDRLCALTDSARLRPQPAASHTVLDDIDDYLGLYAADSLPSLTSRERLILSHIVVGETRNQISSQLSVSPNTIKTQIRSIYRKLGAANRHEAVDRANKYGIAV